MKMLIVRCVDNKMLYEHPVSSEIIVIKPDYPRLYSTRDGRIKNRTAATTFYLQVHLFCQCTFQEFYRHKESRQPPPKSRHCFDLPNYCLPIVSSKYDFWILGSRWIEITVIIRCPMSIMRHVCDTHDILTNQDQPVAKIRILVPM